jgi:hypothetical protein
VRKGAVYGGFDSRLRSNADIGRVLITNFMIKLKWGEIPLGSVVYDANSNHPQAVVSTTRKSVSVLDLYHNRLTRKRASTHANVVFKQASV